MKDCEGNAGDESDQQGKLPAIAIADIGDEGQRNNLAEWVYSVYEAEYSSFWFVEELSPLWKSLEAIHHRT